MTPVISSSVVLVVADSNFVSLCKDSVEYLARLRKILGDRTTNVTVMTVSGRYGVNSIDNSFKQLIVDDKNKTVFGQTLENVAGMVDELLVVSNVSGDPFISAAKEVLGNAQKTITTYRYERK